VAGLIGLGSCDEVAEALDFGIPMTFDHAFVMSISATDDNTFEEVMAVDASGNQEVKDNIDHIAKFDLNKVAFIVTSFTGDDAIVADGMVQFFNDEGNIGAPISTGNIAFKALVDSGDETIIAVSNELKSTLEDKLLQDQAFSMRMYGTVSDKPITTNMTMIVEVEAKVKF